MNRNFFRLLLSAVLLMCCTVMAWADLGTPPGNEIWYTTDNDKMLSDSKYEVGKTLCNHGIKEHGKKDGHFYIHFDGDIDKIYEGAFDDQDDITEISLPNTIVNICEKAFQDCDELVTFHMPNSVHWLGYAAFYHCNNLKEVTFSSNLESIGYAEDSYGVFEECDALESVTLPASVKYIGRNAFYDCDKLLSFSCENLEYIYPQAFYHCDVLKSVNLGTKLKEIQWSSQGKAYGLFEECDELEVIAIPASVTSIGRNAFYDCDKLKFVAIGSGVTSIAEQAFYNCNSLKSVAIDGNGVSIGNKAFSVCKKLESVSFLGNTPPSSFGTDCFYDCNPNLKYHVLEENYERYNGSSFLNGKVVAGPPYNEIWYTTNNGGTAGYTHLTETPPPLNAYMGNHGVQFFDGNPPEFRYGYNCFYKCYNLVSAVLPSSITFIGGSAFDDCHNLVSVSIPSTVTGIGEYAFAYCTSLQSIKFPDELNYIGGCAFESCKSLQSLTIPSRVNNIPLDAFESCGGLRSVTFLGTIQSFDGYAFWGCWNLSEIFYLGHGTPDVGWRCFEDVPATVYVKDVDGLESYWGDCPVRSWRSGRGDGSAANPLEIENYPQLYGFSLEVAYMLNDMDDDTDDGTNLCAKLTADIIGNNNVLNEDGTPQIGSFKPWLPIGGVGNEYKGKFDGGGHTVSGLYINDENWEAVGLFGKVAGANDNPAYIHDVGVKDSYFHGKLHVGGICGDLSVGRIENCWSAATVQARISVVGGIAGSCRTYASISNCHNVGKVSEVLESGGICGSVYSSQIDTYSLSNCVSLDTKCTKAYTLAAGCPESKIHNVSRKNATAFASGEVCWMLNGSKEGNTWRQQLRVDGYPIQSGDYFLYYSSVANKYFNYDEDISGSGTMDDPYRIGNYFELQKFADIVNTKNATACAILTADITINKGVLDSNGDPNSGPFEVWTPIGDWGNGSGYNGYSGEFNGNGHTISGLYLDDENRTTVGLFGMADNFGYIHDVGIKDSYFRGMSHVAGICGDLAKGRIENCWNGATVIAPSGYVGGLTGSCWYSSSVSGCYNIGKVSSTNSNVCGGICGSVTKNVDDRNIYVSDCVSLYGKCDRAYNLSSGTDTCIISNVSIQNSSAFASGEACYILNGNKTGTKWRQQLGMDTYPVWTGGCLVGHSEEKGYYNETMCEKGNGIHSFEKKVVTKCNDSTVVYWHCSACGKDYKDADRTREETVYNKSSHSPECVKAILPTESAEGRYRYYQCAKCSVKFKDELCCEPWASDNDLIVPKASENEIWYTSTNNQKVTPHHTTSSTFGATYNDANSIYEYGLGKITFDKKVTSINNGAFASCSSLRSIEIPKNVTSIGDYAFEFCGSLQSINIPSDSRLTSIGVSAFAVCGSLQSINIPSGVTSIEQMAFDRCFSLQSINIPLGVTSIGQLAFSSCVSLQSINIPSDSKLTSIEGWMFMKCSSLESIEFPSGITSIGRGAILNCSSLRSVIFHSIPNIVTGALTGSDRLSSEILDLIDSEKPHIGTSLSDRPSARLAFTEARYHRTLEKDTWGTIVLPFAPTGGMEGLEFYELKEMTTESGGSLVFTKVETVKAGVPYLFRNTSSTSDFTLTNAAQPNTSVGVTVGISSQTVGDFTLKGSFQQTQLDGAANGNLYYLKGGEFYHANGKINIAPFRAYIEGNGSSGVQARNFLLLVGDDEVTAIADILDEDGAIEEAEAIYDLGGRRLDAPVKGQVNIVRLASGKTIKRMF